MIAPTGTVIDVADADQFACSDDCCIGLSGYCTDDPEADDGLRPGGCGDDCCYVAVDQHAAQQRQRIALVLDALDNELSTWRLEVAQAIATALCSTDTALTLTVTVAEVWTDAPIVSSVRGEA